MRGKASARGGRERSPDLPIKDLRRSHPVSRVLSEAAAALALTKLQKPAGTGGLGQVSGPYFGLFRTVSLPDRRLDSYGSPPGAGALFGLAVKPGHDADYYVDDATNTLNLLHH
jgi:hypothetical protein